MEIDQFAMMTRRVIGSQGFEGFQPTLCLPERRDVRALAGAPEGPQEDIALQWAAGIAKDGEEYLVAFKHTSTEFKIVRVVHGEPQQAIYAIEA